MKQERMAFVIRASSGQEPMRQLCREFEIARSTGYQWKRRLAECASLAELGEHSRRPHHSPRKTASAIEQQVVALRREFGWGARKLQVLLAEKGNRLPASTINRIIERNGLAVMNQNIRLCFSGFRHPQTQGKVERFHRTLKRDLLHHGQPKTMAGFAQELSRFRQTYNERRPHEALRMQRQAQNYRTRRNLLVPAVVLVAINLAAEPVLLPVDLALFFIG